MVLTAGTTVFGSGIKLMANPTDEWRWIAFCGKHCDTCSAYLNNQCWSCKSTQGLNGACSVKRCAIDIKEVPTCAHCNELDTCDDQFWSDNPNDYIRVKELRDNLNITHIKKNAGSEQDILLFPNPAHDYLSIQNQQNHTFNYELVNIKGQILKKGTIENKELTINISDLKPASYLFRLIRNKNVLQIQKIVKV